MKISCSIVCYRNPPDQVARVLQSIRSSGQALDVCLVDNAEAGILSHVARTFGARYVHLPQNPGYGGGHNVAIRQALKSGVDYHLVLNPDIHFSADVIPALVAFMESHGDVGMVSPRVQYPNGRPQHLCKLLPNPLDLLIRRFCPPLHRLTGRMAHYELHQSGYDRLMDVPALSGCFMLIRASVLRDTGPFDERFFLYFEDVDLTRRVGAVARTVYFPHVAIVHEYAKGSYKNVRLMGHHLRSAVKYFNKWGWFADAQRDRINGAAIRRLQLQAH